MKSRSTSLDDDGGRGIWAYDIVRWSLGLSVLLFAGLLIGYGYTEEGVRQAIRWSARISFSLFCLAFSAAAVHHQFKNSFSWWLRMNRKYFGISFAIVHFIHLGFLALLHFSFHPLFEMKAALSLLGGGVTYFFIATMLLTSFESFSKYFSKSLWRTWHTIGGYLIFVFFLGAYLKRVSDPVHWIYVLVLVLILCIRLNQLRSKSNGL